MHFEFSRIVRTFMAFVVFAVLGTLSAGAQMITTTQPYSGTTTNPCNGEAVVFSGTIYYHEKTAFGRDGRIHFVANNNFHATGYGQSTGSTYNLSGVMHTNSKFPSFPITFRQRNRFISNGAAPSFHTAFAFHVNGNGVQSQVSTIADCNG